MRRVTAVLLKFIQRFSHFSPAYPSDFRKVLPQKTVAVVDGSVARKRQKKRKLNREPLGWILVVPEDTTH